MCMTDFGLQSATGIMDSRCVQVLVWALFNGTQPGATFLVEPCTSDYLKHNYPEQDYPMMHQLVRDIKMDGRSGNYNQRQIVNDRVGAAEISAIDANQVDLDDDTMMLGNGTIVNEEEEDWEHDFREILESDER